MLEIQVTVTAPELSAAVNRLADALAKQMPQAVALAEPIAVSAEAPTPEPVPTPTPTPAPVESPSAIPVTPAPAAVPVASPPAYTLDQIAKAGASLVDAGKMDQLLALLAKHGVAAVTQIQPDQYGIFATELRALGTQI